MLQPAPGGYDSVEVTPSARVVWPTLSGHDPGNRSIVTVEVTPAGRDLVARVVARRHVLLAEVLDRMAPAERACAARAARRFAELAADAGNALAAGPLPL
jgi:hypothetical protein